MLPNCTELPGLFGEHPKNKPLYSTIHRQHLRLPYVIRQESYNYLRQAG